MSDQPRPAYVQFEIRAVEDRTRSIEAGHYVPKDVIFAIITPAGTKDRIEKPANEWLEGVEEGVRQERVPPDWLYAYRRSYENFKESRENPEFGTAIKDWPAISPAQTRMLLDINIRTVEDLAEATEEAVSRIGMGARALKQKAQAWLDAASGTGKVSAEIDELRQLNTELEARDKERQAKFEVMEKRLAALEKQPELIEIEED